MPSAAMTMSASATVPSQTIRAQLAYLLTADTAAAGAHDARRQRLGEHLDQIRAMHAERRVPA